MTHALKMARNQHGFQAPWSGSEQGKSSGFSLTQEGQSIGRVSRANGWRRSLWPCREANGGACPWATSRSIPRPPHLAAPAPIAHAAGSPSTVFPEVLPAWKVLFKGHFPSLFYFLLGEKPRGCKMQSFPPS